MDWKDRFFARVRRRGRIEFERGPEAHTLRPSLNDPALGLGLDGVPSVYDLLSLQAYLAAIVHVRDHDLDQITRADDIVDVLDVLGRELRDVE